MGMEPTYPSEKYGYIIPTTKEQISKVSMFKEKPTSDVAKDYISKGALWNGGVFAFKLRYLIKKAHELIDFKNYQDLFNKYESLNKISFDYAVAEKESKIEVMRFSGKWEDLGSWNTLTESMDTDNIGNVVIGEGCSNNHVINGLDIPVLCVGVKDLIVASSPEGVLVTNKEGASKIKSYVEKMDTPIMFAEKSWGEYRVIDIGKTSMTIKVTLNKGHQMSYHSHQRRDEVWTIVSGTGTTIVDGMKQHVHAGDVITMEAGVRHMIIAETDISLIEVQLGKDIDVKDKTKYDLP